MNIYKTVKSLVTVREAAERYEISSQRLYELYKLWCQDNALNALSLHSFCVQMAALSGDYRLEQTNRIRVNGHYVRDYVGIYSDLPP